MPDEITVVIWDLFISRAITGEEVWHLDRPWRLHRMGLALVGGSTADEAVAAELERIRAGVLELTAPVAVPS